MKLNDLFEKTYNYRLGNASFVRVLENPTYSQILGECNRILRHLYLNLIDGKNNVELRILSNTKTFLLWDAWDATHEKIIEVMGLNKFEFSSYEAGFNEDGVNTGMPCLLTFGSKNNKSFDAMQKALPVAQKTMNEFIALNKDKLLDY